VAFIIDNRNGLGISTTIELINEPEKQIGTTSGGKPRFIYYTNIPQTISKTTYSVFGTFEDWNVLTSQVDNAYKSITSTPTGIFIESLSTNGWFIINNENYYSGSYTETDYSPLEIGTPPEEYKIEEYSSNDFSPDGYLPSGEIYYTKYFTPTSISRSSTISLEKSNSLRLGELFPDSNSKLFISSKSISNIRIINDIEYCDLSLQLTELVASNIIYG
jgi:hypothetical protein